MKPPPWTQIRSQLHGWIHTAVDLGKHTAAGALPVHELPLRLARLHCSFETIHPFLDGTGRAGRLLLNLLLVRLGWPPAIIFKRSRDRYLDALDRSPNSSPDPSWTTCNDSSSPTSQDQPA